MEDIKKEYREFFLRDYKINNGAKADRELSFPVKYLVNGKEVFNRFLKGHFPSENIWKKLFESLTFKLNTEDTATEDIQGLAKIAKDQAVVNRQSKDAGYTTFVEPHQIPEIITEQDNAIDTVVSEITRNGVTLVNIIRTQGDKSRQVYLLKTSGATVLLKEAYLNPLKSNTTLSFVTLKSITIDPDVITEFTSLKVSFNFLAEPTGGVRLLWSKNGTDTEIFRVSNDPFGQYIPSNFLTLEGKILFFKDNADDLTQADISINLNIQNVGSFPTVDRKSILTSLDLGGVFSFQIVQANANETQLFNATIELM